MNEQLQTARKIVQRYPSGTDVVVPVDMLNYLTNQIDRLRGRVKMLEEDRDAWKARASAWEESPQE